jgi:hypothetical protein
LGNVPQRKNSSVPSEEEMERGFEFFRLVSAVVGYDAPNEPLLLDWLRAVSDATPPAVLNLTGDAEEGWRERLHIGVGHVRDGHRAAYYHRGNVKGLVDDLVRTIREREGLVRDVLKWPGEGSFGGSASAVAPRLGFEYQAFLFAERRTLEYLASAVAQFFKRHCHSIKGLRKAIREAEPATQRDAVLARLATDLPDLVSMGDQKSARDRLAHWEALDAGYVFLLVRPDGVVSIGIHGGGENLQGPEAGVLGVEPDRTVDLLAAMDARLARSERFIGALLKDIGLPIPGAVSDHEGLSE